MNEINKRPLKILLVTSDKKLFDLIKRLTENFQENRIELCWKKTERTASQAIKTLNPDVCLIDDRFQKQTDLNLLYQTIVDGYRKPIILLTDGNDEQYRLKALRIGAAYCLEIEKLAVPLFEQTIGYAVESIGGLTELRENVVKFRNLVETLPVMIYAVEPHPPYAPIYVSPAFEAFGYPLEKWNESVDFWLSLLHPEDRERILSETAEAMKSGRETDFEYRIVARNQDVYWVHDCGRFVRDTNGKAVCWQGIILDISKRRQAEKALINSESRYRSLGEGIMHQVWTAQPNGVVDYVNQRTLDYFGQNSEQMTGIGWQSMVHPDDLPECIRRWTHSLATGEDYETEFRLRRRDGEYCWHQARATAGLSADGKIINWFGTNTDINDRKIAEAKLNHFAGHDPLTNLPNRAKFMNYLERAITRSEYSPAFRFAVLFLDLDRFKIINDSLGHTTGDKLLIALAKRLEECLRPNDIVARLGGDEFTVLLNNIAEPDDAIRVARRILEKLSLPFNLDAYEVFTSASIGIIVSDEVKRQPEDFLRDADTAMYRAKEAGKSRYEIFDREMHIRNMNLLQMENDLRRAIGQNEFRVYYQPIIELETGEIREFEALIRWQHPQHGLVPPNEFICIAEETGLIIPIGKWILEESCRQTAEWQKRFPLYKNLSISVNLSAKQLMHPDLTAQVGGILRNTALNSRFLNLEVTESMVMENGDKALAVISELNRLGIALSTDDFGTGYSSLSYLHRFPFSRLKIDRSFVSKMDSDQKSEAIVRTILLLAQNLNIEVVAEGIETEPQLDSLRHLGCKTGQGYFFSKPVPAETAALLLQNGLPNINSTPFYGFRETENHQLLELDKIQ
jgi:diguanylate cyclase (GGDEF)-like protein/PAS domain S-box-containing protein